uniref:C-type lectin domain-containing protein n=1 Tax=Sinocyclocheilus anshuiensis TaxID=1608454 RepID=A0A671P928_9TELE
SSGSFRAAAVCLVLLCVLLLARTMTCGNVLVKWVIMTTSIQTFNINNVSYTVQSWVQTVINKLCSVEENEELIVKLFLFTDQSCLYYFSSEKKSWTESRKYCREKGADLIIINNREEQVSEIYCVCLKWSDNNRVWIGLTDSDEEGTWKWVDGSTLTSGFWMFGEPSGHRRENCALTVVGEWADHPCTEEYNWMCEKRKIAYKPPPICLVWQCLYDYLKYTYEREFKCQILYNPVLSCFLVLLPAAILCFVCHGHQHEKNANASK